MKQCLMVLAFLGACFWQVSGAQAAEDNCLHIGTWPIHSWLLPALSVSDTTCDPGDEVVVEVFKNVQAMTDALKSGKIEVLLTFEAATAMMLEGGDFPQLVAAYAKNHFANISTAPLSDMVDKVWAVERCSDTDEHPDGSDWRDITDPKNVTYERSAPSLNTITMRETFVAATGKELPENVVIICGKGFSDGFRPVIEGNPPMVFIQYGADQKTGRRSEMIIEGKVAGATQQLDFVANVVYNRPDAMVIPIPAAAEQVLPTGLFVMPSAMEKHKDVLCRFNDKVAKATAAFKAGEVTPNGDTFVLDEVANAAFVAFKAQVAREDMPNNSKGAAQLMERGTDAVNEEASEDAKLHLFARSRQFWRDDFKVTPEEIDAHFKFFNLPEAQKAKFYNPICG